MTNDGDSLFAMVMRDDNIYCDGHICKDICVNVYKYLCSEFINKYYSNTQFSSYNLGRIAAIAIVILITILTDVHYPLK